jgi:hypothetical protein
VNETKRRFVICLRNDGVGDLELHKLYEVLPDEKATRVGYLRVIDESGEDYRAPTSSSSRRSWSGISMMGKRWMSCQEVSREIRRAR